MGKKMIPKRVKSGFTLIELIIVIAVLAIVLAIAVPGVSGLIRSSRSAVDTANLKILNDASLLFRAANDIKTEDLFEGLEADEQRQSLLVENGFLLESIEAQTKNSYFHWIKEDQVWGIIVGGELIPLTPVGNTLGDISISIIESINSRYEETGSYGRSWGDYRYTDIGLDPEYWANPYDHAYYKPSGHLLRISPESGYAFSVLTLSGEERELTSSHNWDLIFDAITQKWYYHSVKSSNAIDINTLEIGVE
jgi:prepilin-type N-terminal cleavage/methylation domain-containing protein